MSELFDFSIINSGGSYQVIIGEDITVQNIADKNQVWFVDEKLSLLYSHLLPANYLTQHSVESEKNLNSVGLVISKLRDLAATRDTHLIAVGGGIVQDIATFSASCYMRGISWTYFPTTLLSMVDSCIGGKSSINIGQYKNLAGNFYPPEKVIIDTRFCKSLNDQQISEGLCEAAKICFAESDETFLSYLLLIDLDSKSFSSIQIAQIVNFALRSKKKFIEEDEFDQGIRQLLNFGHTFGHAIEASSKYSISHGIAVGLGILAARNISLKMGLTPSPLPVADKLTCHIKELLRNVNTLRSSLKSICAEEAMEKFQSDKKHTKENFYLILFNSEGRLHRIGLPKSDYIKLEIMKTFNQLIEDYYEI